MLVYLLLSLSAQVNWVVVVAVTSLVLGLMAVYSIYQIVGLYYLRIFKEKREEPKGSDEAVLQPTAQLEIAQQS
jgi:hypothetical protein